MLQKQPRGAPAAEEPEAHQDPYLGRELRIELNDGRVIVGSLIAYEGCGDLLLQSAVEQRCSPDGALTHRGLNLLAVPFKYVKTLHRRAPGRSPVMIEGRA